MKNKLEKEARFFRRKFESEFIPEISERDKIEVAFEAGAQWQKENMWTSVGEDLPDVEKPVFVLTTKGNIAVSKMYIPKDCNGYVLGGKEWKGSNTFKESIIAWMPRPPFEVRTSGDRIIKNLAKKEDPFTQPCFIRKSSKELVDKVYRMGGREGRGFWYSEYSTLLLAEKNQFTCFDDEWGNADDLIKAGFIDCGVQEDLFLAIAALKCESDKHQWFTDGIHWEMCPDGKANIQAWVSLYKTTPHKASVEELINHFK